MVANAQGDVRQAAAKPDVADLKAARAEVVVDDRQPTEDQVAAAAAATDAEQAAAVEVAAEAGILPTEAPIQSIGEYAQAPAPATTTTTPTTAPAAETSATPQYNPWVVGGAAVLGIGAIAAVANDDDDNDPPPVAEEPPPAPPPGGEPPAPPPGGEPPANAAPTSLSQETTLSDTGATPVPIPYTDAENDPLASITIGAVTVNPLANVPGGALQFDAVSGHGYQLVAGEAPVTWEAANAAAQAAGGHLAIIDSLAEMTFIQSAYDGLGGPDGTDGTWIGLTQAPQPAMGDPGAGWSWVDGSAFAGDSELWNDQFGGLPNDGGGGEDSSNDRGAIYDGIAADDTALIYDWATAGTLPKYLIEFDSPVALNVNGAPVADGQTIAAADLAALSWDSMFNAGGSFTYSITPAAGTAQPEVYTATLTPAAAPASFDAGASMASLVEDQHLNVLA